METLFHFSQWLQNVHWIFWVMSSDVPAAATEVTHYFSFFLVVGPVAIVDLRLLGATHRDQQPSVLMRQFYPMILVGLIVTTITGFIQAAGSATQYYDNDVFYYKMLVFAAAIIVTVIVAKGCSKWEQLPSIPMGAKVLAVLSILLWIGTILAGVEVPALTGVG